MSRPVSKRPINWSRVPDTSTSIEIKGKIVDFGFGGKTGHVFASLFVIPAL